MEPHKIKNIPEIKNQDAGVFSSWLRRIKTMLDKGNGISVPCGACRGCCTSSKFIHIRPEEKQTLARIPKKLLFPAPLLGKGNMLLGYDEKGHCPMLNEGNCSIYEHRPITCRNYDCRIFCAAGIAADDDDKKLINNQVKRWRFSFPCKSDHALHSAVKSAAIFIRDHSESFPDKRVPASPSQLAILAIKVYDVFLKNENASVKNAPVKSDREIAGEIIKASKEFR